MDTRMCLCGSLTVEACSDLRKASCTSGPKAATSPVDAISTPSDGSAPSSRLKENMGDLTATMPPRAPEGFSATCFGMGSGCTPFMARVAASMRLMPSTLEANGADRDARTLHSITDTWPSLTMSCMLKGPVISSAPQTVRATSSILASSAGVRPWGGSMSVASPECTPAFSTCSMTARARSLPLSPTPSTSISRPFSTNLEMTTGCSRETSAASLRKPASSSGV
mmetsp:Transcript_10101/g.29762  ORF Transcript_10101/g.29762 Transcript_10101/m.29762 type:complete len:225 (-) Transcript_10101:1935-2609(-)